MPQLDSLRALAVFFVLAEHWFTQGLGIVILPFGMIGVTTFFVLSGFLITQILIKSKIRIDAHANSIFYSLKQFYARRTLRIFPIYYITIFIAFLLNFQTIRDKIFWYIFYISNIYFYKNQDWDGALSHLWTLAVEEQFYVVWPLIIFFISRKYLFRSILFFILFGMIFRSILFYFSDHSENAFNFLAILTPSCLDSFGLGAVLAFLRCYKNELFNFSGKPYTIFLLLNILLMVILLFFEESILSAAMFKFNVSVIALFLISGMSIGFKGLLKSIFENRALMYLGKISYGLYLFHNFIPHIYNFSGLPQIHNLFFRFLIQFVFLIVISSISWFLVEKPVNNLKKYFKYN